MKMGSVAVSPSHTLRVWRADGVWERGRGLLGRPALDWNEGFWIEPCNSVHTAFMGYSLDLVFVDAKGVICRLVEDVKPWRMAANFGARATLEMRSGQLQRCAWRVGDRLQWQEGIA